MNIFLFYCFLLNKYVKIKLLNKIKHILKQILISIDRVNSLSTLNCRKNSTLAEILENYQEVYTFFYLNYNEFLNGSTENLFKRQYKYQI